MELKGLLAIEPSIRESSLSQFPHGPGGFSMKFEVWVAAGGDFRILVWKVTEFERSCAARQWDWRIWESIFRKSLVEEGILVGHRRAPRLSKSGRA